MHFYVNETICFARSRDISNRSVTAQHVIYCFCLVFSLIALPPWLRLSTHHPLLSPVVRFGCQPYAITLHSISFHSLVSCNTCSLLSMYYIKACLTFPKRIGKLHLVVMKTQQVSIRLQTNECRSRDFYCFCLVFSLIALPRWLRLLTSKLLVGQIWPLILLVDKFLCQCIFSKVPSPIHDFHGRAHCRCVAHRLAPTVSPKKHFHSSYFAALHTHSTCCK